MPIELEPLERCVMDMILAGDDPTLEVLREQFNAAECTERTLTGAGFYTKFSVPSAIPRVTGRKLSHLGDVKAEVEGMQHGAGFVLHLREGAIDYLEGFSYDDPWPASVQNFRVLYLDGNGNKRDLTALWEKWAG